MNLTIFENALFASPGPGPGVRSRVEMIYNFFFFFSFLGKRFFIKKFLTSVLKILPPKWYGDSGSFYISVEKSWNPHLYTTIAATSNFQGMSAKNDSLLQIEEIVIIYANFRYLGRNVRGVLFILTEY